MIQFVYMTAPNRQEAERIGSHLVQKRLAACVNILPQMNSIYWWNGKIEFAEECVIIAKTRKSLTTKLIKEVESTHPYETPCALVIDIKKGTKGYLKWLLKETATPRKQNDRRRRKN
jgi:periplasmic divalent cation tolerance protein